AHLRSIGRLSVVPSLFNINEPVIFGTPIVMNPVFFIPFLLAPEHFHVEFHESGRAACFWIDVHSDADIERLSPQARMDALV
ncbi:PTS transporter subunit EIIC, partial [Klebsiella pneumoniae]|uniref:PTS transporter subunit EIIC n=1 Tax=Klebsiella pneumoniae TaxID=573 RepID=UPI00214BB0AD